jgi:hypothetical protein
MSDSVDNWQSDERGREGGGIVTSPARAIRLLVEYKAFPRQRVFIYLRLNTGCLAARRGLEKQKRC